MNKLCAYLLICCIALLTMQPAVAHVASLMLAKSTHAESCCKAPDKEPQHEDGCCDKGSCNPFTTCACCASYVVTGLTNLDLRPHAPMPGKDYPLHGDQDVAGRGPSDCWHPPEIA